MPSAGQLEEPAGRRVTVLLDDDPTGAQAMADVPVALAWDGGEIGRALQPTDTAVHVITNTRAQDGAGARQVTLEAARAARSDLPDARIVLRGDSTLRAHVYEEFEAVRTACELPAGRTAHLLVPALPAAGRITCDGVHLLRREAGVVRLDQTEYARDGALSYRSSRLVEWADERSGGRLRARDGVEVGLERVRSAGGPLAVASAIADAAGAGGCAVPDVEDLGDLEVIAAGLREAERAGVPVVTRCGPAFAAALCGTAATGPPRIERAGRVLVVCGSFVSGSTAQLAELLERHPGAGVELEVSALAGAGAASAVADASAAIVALLERGSVAIAWTTRGRDPSLLAASSQSAIARNVAEIVRRSSPSADVVVSKGGITSAEIARHGLAGRVARVVGPILPGASLWEVGGHRQVVVPGNVGGPDLLTDIVDLLSGSGAAP